MVLLKMMIIWSNAQELAHQSDPTLGPETASARGQVRMMALVKMKRMILWSIAQAPPEKGKTQPLVPLLVQ